MNTIEPPKFLHHTEWEAMPCWERYLRYQMALMVANAYGREQDKLPITPYETWKGMSESNQKANLSSAELDCANRIEYAAMEAKKANCWKFWLCRNNS